ncbi:MAG: enoyl-CoA hydratase-related protein [Bdellovibrionota bacterium]|nr:enoyl-CoA hydratase-related protein [Bdellovibrionota bacterium]
MAFKHIKYECLERTALIVINRPEVYNALNKESKDEIQKAIGLSEENKEIGSIIITSEGKAFCTGQDLNDRSVSIKDGGTVDLGHTLETEWNPLMNSIKKSSKVVIGAINGVCAGAGLPLAVSCDLIVAKPKTKFISGFSKLGLIPDAGSSFTFTRALGYQKALEFFLLNEPLTSEVLFENKLVNFIDENPLEFSKGLAKKINALSPASVKMIKQNLQFSLEETYAKSMEKEVNCQRILGHSDNYKEGLNAFFEKREAHFSRD